MEKHFGRAFIGDGIATVISAGVRHRCHHLCTEHWCDGRHQSVFHGLVRRGRADGHTAGLVP